MSKLGSASARLTDPGNGRKSKPIEHSSIRRNR
jgi:hypothetical protein